MPSTRIWVRAVHGDRPVPMAGAPRRRITRDPAVQVEDNAYYRRQIRDGDLELVEPATRNPPRAERPAGEV